MAKPVVVLDAGSGNLRSVAKALSKSGGDPIVSSDPDVIRQADRIVVPGQGAFADFMAALDRRDLRAALIEVMDSGRPYLGICLGLQILFEQSEEHGPIPGLARLAGKVVRFRDITCTDGRGIEVPLKIPHMGWNRAEPTPRAAAEPLLTGIVPGSHFYFVHSYYGIPGDPAVVVLTCDYGGSFAAAVRHENLFACQFHPEKSQAVGLRLLANFVETT